jgi:hypothetical protein
MMVFVAMMVTVVMGWRLARRLSVLVSVSSMPVVPVMLVINNMEILENALFVQQFVDGRQIVLELCVVWLSVWRIKPPQPHHLVMENMVDRMPVMNPSFDLVLDFSRVVRVFFWIFAVRLSH